MRTLPVICAPLEHGISNGTILILVGISLVVFDERWHCALSVAGGLELVYPDPSRPVLRVITD